MSNCLSFQKNRLRVNVDRIILLNQVLLYLFLTRDYFFKASKLFVVAHQKLFGLPLCHNFIIQFIFSYDLHSS